MLRENFFITYINNLSLLLRTISLPFIRLFNGYGNSPDSDVKVYKNPETSSLLHELGTHNPIVGIPIACFSQ